MERYEKQINRSESNKLLNLLHLSLCEPLKYYEYISLILQLILTINNFILLPILLKTSRRLSKYKTDALPCLHVTNEYNYKYLQL